MWWKLIIVALVALVFISTLVNLYGKNRWRSDTKELYAKMEAGRVPIRQQLYDPRKLEGIPEPVQRYFNTVLKEGQPLVTAVNVEHTGTFNMGKNKEQWTSFKSTQRVVTQRPSFIWDARIRMAPAMMVHVLDAYIAGEGILTAKLFGFLTVMKQPRTPELAEGELMRFLAEGAWYPTAFLPNHDQAISWEAIDDSHARARLTDGATTVKLVFQFDAQGLIRSVRSDRRYREVDGALVATSWQGRFWNYELRDGMLIALEGEVAWLLQDGPQPYWRGRIQRIKYEYAQ